VGVPSLLVASYTALTRIADDAHWYSDVVAGATLGIFWGRATYAHHEGGSQARLDPWILDDGGTGLLFSYQY
jgi:membrane-associated phospholipid phosphatase